MNTEPKIRRLIQLGHTAMSQLSEVWKRADVTKATNLKRRLLTVVREGRLKFFYRIMRSDSTAKLSVQEKPLSNRKNEQSATERMNVTVKLFELCLEHTILRLAPNSKTCYERVHRCMESYNGVSIS